MTLLSEQARLADLSRGRACPSRCNCRRTLPRDARTLARLVTYECAQPPRESYVNGRPCFIA
jgi:hypothetical protein